MTNLDSATGVPCAYCGAVIQRPTKDHVFPRAWYPTTTPPKLKKWTVPSCAACNNAKSRLESYCRRALAACVDTNSVHAKGIWEPAFRGIKPSAARDEADRGHRQRAFESFQHQIIPARRIDSARIAYFSQANSSGRLGLNVNWEMVTRLMTLFVRGCHCYIDGAPLPPWPGRVAHPGAYIRRRVGQRDYC